MKRCKLLCEMCHLESVFFGLRGRYYYCRRSSRKQECSPACTAVLRMYEVVFYAAGSTLESGGPCPTVLDTNPRQWPLGVAKEMSTWYYSETLLCVTGWSSARCSAYQD